MSDSEGDSMQKTRLGVTAPSNTQQENTSHLTQRPPWLLVELVLAMPLVHLGQGIGHPGTKAPDAIVASRHQRTQVVLACIFLPLFVSLIMPVPRFQNGQ